MIENNSRNYIEETISVVVEIELFEITHCILLISHCIVRYNIIFRKMSFVAVETVQITK